jgi:hypothetical protein
MINSSKLDSLIDADRFADGNIWQEGSQPLECEFGTAHDRRTAVQAFPQEHAVKQYSR